jgi:S-adenosylmethionine:tRNA ribosyltransferase-isomerase
MDRLSDYDYHLPEAAIAQKPLDDRSASRLLWLHRKSGEISHHGFREVAQILQPHDLLVVNDTRVSAVRLFGHKTTGGQVEALLLSAVGLGSYEALVKPGKRLRIGARIEFAGGLVAEVTEERGDGLKLLQFDLPESIAEQLARIGLTPLPPYSLERLEDPERYQTVYATSPGSAAAPTAGLHFTHSILAELEAKGVKIARVTLDVGIDTFRPVQAEDLDQHHMHGERCSLPQATEAAIRECTGRIVAVGTTAVRTLESFAIGPRRVESGQKSTSLFIRPGYEFQVVDGMFTNFHMPRTTMLMMISALANREAIFRAYQEALEQQYRFLSFGDSMLIL